MTSEIYRGYDIESNPKGGYVIRKGGQVVCSQPSLDFAHRWIDEQRRAEKFPRKETPPLS